MFGAVLGLPLFHKRKKGKGNCMKTLKIGEKEYSLEFSFAAAEHKALVQNMFNVMSGAYIVKNGVSAETENGKNATMAMINGVSEMVADIPQICRVAFYAGLLENSPVKEDEAKELMKQYMRENKMSFHRLFEELKQCMEDDGFFDLSGLTEMIQSMNSAAENQVEKVQNGTVDKKSTSTK